MGEAAPALAASAQDLRILVIDDDANSARLLVATLELKGSGHVVAMVTDARQALRQVPEFEQLVLVALTGRGDKDVSARSTAAGFDHHLPKRAGLQLIDALLLGIAGDAKRLLAAPRHRFLGTGCCRRPKFDHLKAKVPIQN